MLNEVAVVNLRLHRLLVGKVVVHAVLLTRPRLARRVRHTKAKQAKERKESGGGWWLDGMGFEEEQGAASGATHPGNSAISFLMTVLLPAPDGP